jgi:hypothetical protein
MYSKRELLTTMQIYGGLPCEDKPGTYSVLGAKVRLATDGKVQ